MIQVCIENNTQRFCSDDFYCSIYFVVQCAIGIVFSGAMFWMFGYGIVMGDSHLGTPFYGLGDVSGTK